MTPQAHALLTEALPIIRDDARRWEEDASEDMNRRRQAASADLAARIEQALFDSPPEEPMTPTTGETE